MCVEFKIVFSFLTPNFHDYSFLYQGANENAGVFSTGNCMKLLTDLLRKVEFDGQSLFNCLDISPPFGQENPMWSPVS